MISSEDSNAVLEANLERDKERQSFDGVVASIDIVPHEEVVSVWGLPANFKQLPQIVELTMNVATDRNWGLYLLHV